MLLRWTGSWGRGRWSAYSKGEASGMANLGLADLEAWPRQRQGLGLASLRGLAQAVSGLGSTSLQFLFGFDFVSSGVTSGRLGARHQQSHFLGLALSLLMGLLMLGYGPLGYIIIYVYISITFEKNFNIRVLGIAIFFLFILIFFLFISINGCVICCYSNIYVVIIVSHPSYGTYQEPVVLIAAMENKVFSILGQSNS